VRGDGGVNTLRDMQKEKKGHNMMVSGTDGDGMGGPEAEEVRVFRRDYRSAFLLGLGQRETRRQTRSGILISFWRSSFQESLLGGGGHRSTVGGCTFKRRKRKSSKRRADQRREGVEFIVLMGCP